MRTVRTFYILMLTQALSLIGSGMTSIAVGIRVFTETGDTTGKQLSTTNECAIREEAWVS